MSRWEGVLCGTIRPHLLNGVFHCINYARHYSRRYCLAYNHSAKFAPALVAEYIHTPSCSHRNKLRVVVHLILVERLHLVSDISEVFLLTLYNKACRYKRKTKPSKIFLKGVVGRISWNSLPFLHLECCCISPLRHGRLRQYQQSKREHNNLFYKSFHILII